MSGSLSSQGAIQQRTSAYAQPRDVIVSFRITRPMSERIDKYKMAHRKNSRTQAIIDLLEAALYIMDNADRLKDPAVVKYLQDNLYNIQLVDDVMDWPQDRIEAIIGALASERERRLRIKIGKHYHGR